MNKEEFMTRLKELLADLPDDENKQDALNYYQDYLEEAGENTAAVLKEFGSPERIASMIRCDLNGELNEGGDFTDHGIEDTRFKEPGYDVAKRLDLPEVMEEETERAISHRQYQPGGKWQETKRVCLVADSLDRAGSDSVRSSDRRRRGNPAGYTCRDYRSPGSNSTWNRSWNDFSVLFKRSHADPGNLLSVFS